MDLFRTKPLLITAMIAFIAAVGAGGSIALYAENRTLDTRIAVLEHELGTLADALKASHVISEENQERLNEIANRRQVIASAQDDLLTAAVAKATPAVVSIVISKDVPLLEVQYENPFGNDPFFRDFGFRIPTYRQVGTEKQQVGAGTGFLIREDGHLITNKHVVADTEAEYTVLLSNGEQKPGVVIYRDPVHDLAVLKIAGFSYPTLHFGDSRSLRLGQTVAAIGNALGEYSNSVSVGIISGLDRTIQAQDNFGKVETISGAIQTDAAINPGNSGGPLIDLSGKVVGVNVAVERGANSIGFAIPAHVVQDIMNTSLGN